MRYYGIIICQEQLPVSSRAEPIQRYSDLSTELEQWTNELYEPTLWQSTNLSTGSTDRGIHPANYTRISGRSNHSLLSSPVSIHTALGLSWTALILYQTSDPQPVLTPKKFLTNEVPFRPYSWETQMHCHGVPWCTSHASNAPCKTTRRIRLQNLQFRDFLSPFYSTVDAAFNFVTFSGRLHQYWQCNMSNWPCCLSQPIVHVQATPTRCTTMLGKFRLRGT
jgi:hypothetical protein